MTTHDKEIQIDKEHPIQSMSLQIKSISLEENHGGFIVVFKNGVVWDQEWRKRRARRLSNVLAPWIAGI